MGENIKSYFSRLKFPIRMTVVSVFIMATLITASVAVGLQYYFIKQMATESTLLKFDALAKDTEQFLETLDRQASNAVRVMGSYPAIAEEDDWKNPEVLGVFTEIMNNNPMFYAIYVGFKKGDFYEVINLDSGTTVRKQLNATPDDRWVVIRIFTEEERRVRETLYLDNEFNIRELVEVETDFDPSLRPWFKNADRQVSKSAPYLFQVLQAPGQTYSVQIQGKDAVVAVDIALSSVSDFFANQQVGKIGELYLYESSGEVIASNRKDYQQTLPIPEALELTDAEKVLVAENPVVKVSNELDWAPIDYAVSGNPRGYSIDALNMLSAMLGIEFNFINGFTWSELVEAYQTGDIDILQPVFKTATNQDLGTFSSPFIELPYSLVTLPDKSKVKHIKEAEGWLIAIPKGWSIVEVIRTHFPAIDVKEVSGTRAVLEAVKNKEVDAGLDLDVILNYTAQQFFIDGVKFHSDIAFEPLEKPNKLHLVMAPENAPLMALFNKAIANMSEQQRQALENKWLMIENLKKQSTTVPYKAFIDLVSSPEHHGTLEKVKLDGVSQYLFVTPVGVDESEFLAIKVPVSEILAPTMKKVMFSMAVTAGLLCLLAPLPWIFGSPIVNPIRKLADENEKIKRRQYEKVIKPDSRIKEIDDLGQSMLDMSVSLKQFEKDQEALMDSFIQLIAEAIDDKSPYTAGHCERVPELAFMLAEKAEQSDLPFFKDFGFDTEEQWREFKIGAWLHDCGKITTPEHVVDKGSKLETIYNRIHEIRTRFEILLRDVELVYWQQWAQSPEKEAELKAELEAKQQQIRDDYEFVARMNVGGEFLSDDKKERIKAIADITWTRHLDDRIGLSPLEETRVSGESPTLPVEEKLLQDRPEHLIERSHSVDYDPSLGIKMDVPHYLYNQGELYNLLIERGTLTAEDRFKINEHIISTIRMLENLPFPEELAKVPRYASTHHETMKGTGYPRKLSAEDLSIPERIMVLSDIYEALTASDRPYKKAKPVSVAIDILSKMVDDDHIDREVFELFLTSGVYIDYAKRYLPDSQLDEVDIEKYFRHVT